MGASRFRPASIDQPLPALAVALKTGRHLRRTAWVAPKGSDGAHRVSPLGAGKEVQKLRRGTGSIPDPAAGGGAFRLSPHIKSTRLRGAARTLFGYRTSGELPKKGNAIKRCHPPCDRKTHSRLRDRSTHRPLETQILSWPAAGVGLSLSLGDWGPQGCEKPECFAESHVRKLAWRRHRKVERQRHRSSRPEASHLRQMKGARQVVGTR